MHVAGVLTSEGTWQVLTPGGTQACARSTSQTVVISNARALMEYEGAHRLRSRGVPASTRAIEARLPATGPIRGWSPLRGRLILVRGDLSVSRGGDTLITL